MVTHPGIDEATERDIARVKAELRDRMETTPDWRAWDALRLLADREPDLVNEALDDMGAP